MSPKTVAVVGGCGHVGLPLGIALAHHHVVHAYDIDERAVSLVRSGRLPFREADAEEALRQVLGRTFHVDTSPVPVRACDYVVLVIGTPVDEHLNPDDTLFHKVLAQLEPHLRGGQTLVLRSTVYPGTTEKVAGILRRRGLDVEVVFCPERVAEGRALQEIRSLPQIISGFTPRGLEAARALFGPMGVELVELPPAEAELAKLFTNAWRYISFAVANQFFTAATDRGLDFGRILGAMKHHYPRAAGLPGAGFAAGPCLFKDTMQLAAWAENSFFLGHAAMLMNEGLPRWLVNHLKRRTDLSTRTVGILGMAFKAESDDRRESLSYKLKRILAGEARRVLTTDPYVSDGDLSPLEQVLAESDLLLIGAPHEIYRSLDLAAKPVVDIWSGKGL